jgi:DNA-directed RNA polymerase subunit RPC12/RpoP
MKIVKCAKCGRKVRYETQQEFSSMPEHLVESYEITNQGSTYYLCNNCYPDFKVIQQRFLSSILKDGSAGFTVEYDGSTLFEDGEDKK